MPELPKKPLAPLGHAWHLGGSLPNAVIEIFVDYCCPFSARLFKRFTTEVIPFLSEDAASSVRVIFQQLPQPWHPQSTLLHEAVIAVRHLYGLEKTNEFQTVLFQHQKSFYDSATEDMPRAKIAEALAELAASKISGVDKDAVLERLRVDRSDPEVLNGGTASTRVLKFYVKQHRLLGIHVTPTTRVNGIVCDTSSGWTKEAWLDFLAPYIEGREPDGANL